MKPQNKRGVQYAFPKIQPRPELAPDIFFTIGWLREGWEFATALNRTLGAADVDGCKAERGRRGPSPYICCRAMNWGCICWLLPKPDRNGCEGEPVMIGCLLFRVLFTMEGPTPGGFIDEVTTGGTIWDDTARFRSLAILCLAFSTCSHSFINRVSTSANCFSLSSSLFNCMKQRTRKLPQKIVKGKLLNQGRSQCAIKIMFQHKLINIDNKVKLVKLWAVNQNQINSE